MAFKDKTKLSHPAAYMACPSAQALRRERTDQRFGKGLLHCLHVEALTELERGSVPLASEESQGYRNFFPPQT